MNCGLKGRPSRAISTMSLSTRVSHGATGISRSHSFAGVNSPQDRSVRNASVFSTPSVSRKSATKVRRMFSVAHKTPPPKVPQPERLDEVYEALKRGLSAYIEFHQLELNKLTPQVRESKRNSRLGFLYDLDKQTKSIERFIRRLEFHVSKIDELYDAYCIQRRLRDGAHNMVKAYNASPGSPGSREARESLAEAMRGYKEYNENMCVLETELENRLGEFHVKMKGLAGFARLCAGDQYEIFMKYGRQRWKLRGRIEINGKQVWDSEEMIFLPLVTEFLSIKVTELKSLANHVIVGSVSCETKDLFAALPQMVAVDINDLGTIKLNLEVTWNPFDKDEPPTSAATITKVPTVNKRFSTYNQSPPDTPSLREQAFYLPHPALEKHGWSLLDIFRETIVERLSRSCSCNDVSSVQVRSNMLRRQEELENGTAWSISSESSDDSSSPQLSTSVRHSQKILVQPTIQTSAPPIEITFTPREEAETEVPVARSQEEEEEEERVIVKNEVVANGHVPYLRSLSHISETSVEAAILDSKDTKNTESSTRSSESTVEETVLPAKASSNYQDTKMQFMEKQSLFTDSSKLVQNTDTPLLAEMQTTVAQNSLKGEQEHAPVVQTKGVVGELSDISGSSKNIGLEPVTADHDPRKVHTPTTVSHEPGKGQDPAFPPPSTAEKGSCFIQESVSKILAPGVVDQEYRTEEPKPTVVTQKPTDQETETATRSSELRPVTIKDSGEEEQKLSSTDKYSLSKSQVTKCAIQELNSECTEQTSVCVTQVSNNAIHSMGAVTHVNSQLKGTAVSPVVPCSVVESRTGYTEPEKICPVASNPKMKPVDPALEEALNTLTSSLDDCRGQFPELQTLEQEVKCLEEILMQRQGVSRSRASSISLTVENALESFNFLNTSDTEDSESSDKEGERKERRCGSNEGGAVAACDLPAEHNSEGNLEPLTTGNEFLDQAIIVHLNKCIKLLPHLGIFGPLRCKEIYARDKLLREAHVLDLICRLIDEKLGTVSGVEEVVPISADKGDILAFWNHCIARPNIYTVKIDRFLQQLNSSYGPRLQERFSNCAETVFIKFAELVLDRRLPKRSRTSCSEPLTVFQYWNYLDSQNISQLEQYILELAGGELRLQNLYSDDQDVVLKTLKRISEDQLQKEELKALGILLHNGSHKVCHAVSLLMKNLAENLNFRERAMVCYLEMLEDEETETRVAGCTALEYLKGKEAIVQLNYLCQTDSADVREAARKTLFSFGEEGKLAYRQMEESLDGLPRIFSQGGMASTAF
ncbi:rho family-interacting cell polarization regulator 1 isoform X2 [Protopterus annectens]|uniref:rho family-interacting cell polarization regulator 1 isoform X2 n=1 Tax=Protopterus annectens TaxID=7888 RepID=UPI001CFBFFA5|nr:rho family-interacting cell polarization regulator 1 isoform X2 [Protopterus annectens]